MENTDHNLPVSFKAILRPFLTAILCVISIVGLGWTAWTRYDVAQTLFCLPFFGILAFLGYHMFFNAYEKWIDYKKCNKCL